eukprot:2713347-Amphidinium_carterae.1
MSVFEDNSFSCRVFFLPYPPPRGSQTVAYYAYPDGISQLSRFTGEYTCGIITGTKWYRCLAQEE